MNVWLKRGLFGLVIALLLALVGLGAFLLTFDPNAYKSRLEQLVFDRYARTLTIRGDIGLSLFPRIGLSVNDVSLSNRNSTDTFISVDGARFAVAIWPLLFSRLVVDHVAITGLKAWVVRDAKGHFNFSDVLESHAQAARATGSDAGVLAVAPAAGHQDFNIDIAGLELKGGQIHYVDQMAGLSTTFVAIEASTGRVTYDQPFDVALKAAIKGDDPVQDARLDAQALLRLDPEVRGYSAQKINVQLTGRLGNLDKSKGSLKGNLAYKGRESKFSADNLELDLSGNIVGAHPVQDLKVGLTAAQLRLDQRNDELKVSKLALRATGKDAGRSIELALDAPALAVSPDSAQGDPISGTLKWAGQDTLGVTLGLEGLSGNANEWQFHAVSLDGALTQGRRLLHLKLTSPLSWDTTLRKGSLSAIKGDMGIKDQALRGGAYEFPMIGSVHVDLVQDLLDADLSAVIDGGQASFKSRTTRLADPQTQFSLSSEKFDLNRWLPPRPVEQATTAPSDASQARKETAKSASPAAAPGPGAAATPARPTVIDLSFLKGQDLQGALQVGDLRVRDLQLTDVNAQVQVRKGALTVPKLTARLYEGTLDGQISATAAQVLGLKLNLDKIAVAPLLQAAGSPYTVSGRGAAQIDLTASGDTVDALQRSLDGRFLWQIRDGAVHGVDASRTLSDVAAALGNITKGRLDALPSPFDKRRSTPFSSLDGRIDLKNGQGTVSKLSLVSSLVRVSEGKPARIDLPERTLDLVLLAQVSARLPKDQAVALGPLAGATIPVRISGPWTHPAYDVQWNEVRNQTVQRAIQSGLIDLLKGRDPLDLVVPVPEPDAQGQDGAQAPRPSTDADPVERIGKALKGLLGQ